MKLSLKNKLLIVIISIILLYLPINYVIFGESIKSYFADKEKEIYDQKMQIIKNDLNTYIDQFKEDAKVLAALEDTQLIANAIDKKSAVYQEQKEHLVYTFENFSNFKPWYLQISYLDESGKEAVRVNRLSADSLVTVVNDANFQDKSGRDYFQEVKKISEGEVYVSNLTLNYENGELQYPHTPTIRFLTPIYNDQGGFKGAIKINIIAQNIFDEIAKYDKNLYYLNADGSYIVDAEDANNNWSIDLEKQTNFFDEHGRVDDFEEISKTENAELVSEDKVNNKIFFYQKINYNDYNYNDYFIIVEELDLNIFLSSVERFWLTLFYYNVAVTLISAAIIYFIIVRITDPIQKMKEAVDKIKKKKYKIDLNVQTNDEINDLAIAIKDMARNLENQNKDRYDFITSASHQLRTPVANINSQLELAKEEVLTCNDPKKARKMVVDFIDSAKNSNQQILSITNDLMDFMEVGYDFSPRKLAYEDLKQMINSIVESYMMIIQKRKINIIVKVPKDQKILVDKNYFSKVLMNLIDNAIVYSNDGGVIKIVSKKRANDILIEISDSGIGIPVSEQPKIFEKFFRAKNSYSKKNVGSGLGLVVAKNIIEGRGGTLQIISQGENKGTKISFTIPRSKKI